MTLWKNGWPNFLPSPWKGMPTARRTPTAVPTPGNSRADMHTGSSRGASGTICLRKLRRRLQKPFSTSAETDRNAASGLLRKLSHPGGATFFIDLESVAPTMRDVIATPAAMLSLDVIPQVVAGAWPRIAHALRMLATRDVVARVYLVRSSKFQSSKYGVR